MRSIQVVDYDSLWPDMFCALRATVWAAVADVALTIEHVGSTAVPGLAGKPIVDMDVVVPDGDVGIGITRLAAIGYHHRGDLGIAQREAFRSPTDTPRHHLYLCPVSSPALRNHLTIRDYLRRHAEVAEAYSALKRRLAVVYEHDMDGYVEAKSEFLISILRDAGVSDESLLEIERMNRRPT